MSTLDLLNPASLGSLAAEIDLLHDEAERHATTAVVYAARCGEKLLKAKAAIGHGQWLDWLAANCRVKERQARKYMTLANEMPELLEPNRHPGADLLGIKHAIALLTADDEVKAEVQARLDAGETVSVRAIEKLKREAQAERETRQQLAAKLQDAQHQNQILHDNLAAASEREQRSYRELLETQEQIASLADEQAKEAVDRFGRRRRLL
jgi:chromosome segregation ATPase